MMAMTHGGGGGGKGGNKKLYREEMQKTGVHIEPLPKGIPMKANPVTPIKHLLGGTPYPHPFIKGREKV